MKVMQHKLADIATKSTANIALMTSMTERVGQLGSLQTEFQNIKKLDNRIEEVAKVTERLEKKAVNQNLAKEVATFTKRLVSLEEDMAQQASNLKPDTYYEDMVTGIVAAITERQVENLPTALQNIKKLDNRIEEVAKVTGRIAEIQQGLENNKQQIENRFQTMEGGWYRAQAPC